VEEDSTHAWLIIMLFPFGHPYSQAKPYSHLAMEPKKLYENQKNNLLSTFKHSKVHKNETSEINYYYPKAHDLKL